MKFRVLIFINICLLFLPYTSLSVDPQYEICRIPQVCGNQSIQFPFFIQGNQKAYCGYPGFNLTCKNNDSLILNISEDDYSVDEIFYNNNSVRVSNVLTLGYGLCILPKFHNFSSPSDQFELNSSSAVALFANCSTSGQEISNYKVGCDFGSVLAMNLNDPNISMATELCEQKVVVPVDDHSQDDTDYLELLRNGFVLKWTSNKCDNCIVTGGFCGFHVPNYRSMCFCRDRPHYNSCIQSSSVMKRRMKMGLGISAAGVLITAVLLCYFWRKCSSRRYVIYSKNGKKDHDKVEAFLKLYGNLAPKRFRYQDIKKMTNSFKCKLGQGGYGGVYKGKLLDDRAVAVKMLNNTKGDGEEFLNEVASISRTSHVNIVSLIGFCFEGSKRALIYEFMPNGSLEKFISHEKSSTVQKLHSQILNQVALGIARGLEYLHRGCSTRILHFDIKPHNILLDAEFRPEISDFGLAKLCFGKESIISMTNMRGTPGYIAPEVFSRNFGGVSHKADVYSYGMLILEMVGARHNINEEVDNCSSEKYFPEWIYDRLELEADQVEQDHIVNEVENESTRKMIIVGLWCIQTYPSNRPSMKRVIEMLEGNLESLHIPPRPLLVSIAEPLESFSTT